MLGCKSFKKEEFLITYSAQKYQSSNRKYDQLTYHKICWKFPMSVCKHQENKGCVEAADIFLREKENKWWLTSLLSILLYL